MDELQKMLHKDDVDTKEIAKEFKNKKETLIKEKAEKGLHMEDKYMAKQRDFLAKNYHADHSVLFNPEYEIDFKEAQATLDEVKDDKTIVLQDMQDAFRKIMKNNSKEIKCQTEEAIWNDLPQRLKYHHSNNGESSEEEGDVENSQDSEAKARKKQEARDTKYEKTKGDLKIETEEESQIPKGVETNLHLPTSLSPVLETGGEGDVSAMTNKPTQINNYTREGK